MAKHDKILQISKLSSGYGESIVIRQVDLSIGDGEIVALLGKNGMGKSTLLKTVMGFLPAQGGSIGFDGTDITREPPHKVARRGISYGPQDKAIFQDLTVGENLKLGLPDPGTFDTEFAHIIEIFPFLRERLNQRAGTLSGGEQKMLILSRSLMMRPRLILIDEITEGLQPSVIDRIATALQRERERTGISMFLVEQNINFALRVADRWAVLKLGEIDDAGDCNAPGAAEQIADHLTV